jgi:hypothetical protein
MSDTTRLIVLNVGFAAVGAAVVLLAGVPRKAIWLPTVMGLAPAVGLAACGLVATVGAMVGIDVTPATTGSLSLVALLVAVLAGRRWGRGSIGTLSPSRSGVPGLALELGCLALLAVVSVRIVRLGAATGLEAWDGWAMWAPKAHALYVQGDVWGPVFADRAYGMQHPEYPVLLPALEALASGAIDRFDPSFADIEGSVAVVAFGWAAWAILRVVVAPVLAAAVAVALTGSAPLIANAVADYGDSVVAAFTSLGLLCVLVWLTRGSTAMLPLAGLFLAAASTTKSEGLLFALAAVAAASVAARGFGRSVRSVLGLAVGVVAVPIMWMIVDRLNGPGGANIDVTAALDPGAAGRIPTAAARLMEEMADGWSLAGLLAIIAVIAAVVARLWWEVLFVVLWGVLAFAALVGVYWVTTDPIDWYLTTSADRVVFSIMLGFATVAPVLIARVWSQATTTFREDRAVSDQRPLHDATG